MPLMSRLSSNLYVNQKNYTVILLEFTAPMH